MNRAEALLNTLNDGFTETPGETVEEYIVVNDDRTVTVPDSLKRLGVQHDHNIETVTIRCPRFWDGRDMSEMTIYVNYLRPDGVKGQYPAANLKVSETSMTFDWVISKNVTQVNGKLSFLICIVKVNEESLEEQHWNSELNQDCYITQGMECNEHIVLAYPDVITYILTKLEEGGTGTPGEPGKDGKSAYEYAKEAGYTGTEEEFAEKLAADIPELDPTLFAKPDWNQNDSTKPDFVNNRTHWIEPRTVILFEAAIEMEPRSNITEGTLINVAENPIPLELTEGKTYIVVWNGRVYSCVCQKQAYYYTGAGYNHFWYLGNLDFVGNAGDLVNNGAEMPFLIRRDECYTNATKQWTTTSTVFTNGNEATVANVTIGGEGAVYHALDEGFIPDTIARKTDIPEGLPEATSENEGKVLGVVDGEWKPVDIHSGTSTGSVQPDWNQNDSTQSDFVKNRTHWEESSQTVIEWDGNTEGLEQWDFAMLGTMLYKVSDATPTLDELYGCLMGVQTGDNYAEMELVGQDYNDIVDLNNQVNPVNCKFIGKFFVVYDIDVNFYEQAFTLTSTGIWVMPDFRKLVYGTNTVYPLDEKFIPDTIARVSDIPSLKSLTLTGAVNASYNGSEEVVVEIPVPEAPAQADMGQNDSSQPDYVKNRTHWEEEVLSTIQQNELYRLAPVENSNPAKWKGRGPFGVGIDYLTGKTYILTVDEKTNRYFCSKDDNFRSWVDPTDNRLHRITWFGNGALIDFPNEEIGANVIDTGENFVLYFYQGESWYFFYVTTEEKTSVDITLQSVEQTTVHTLDEKFIPDTIARKITNKITLVSPSGAPFDITVSDDGVLSVNGTPISGGEVLTDAEGVAF